MEMSRQIKIEVKKEFDRIFLSIAVSLRPKAWAIRTLVADAQAHKEGWH